MEDWGKLLLRVTVGGMMLLHGIHKIFHGIGGIQAMLASAGMPTWLGYGVFIGELVAPVLLIAGIQTRIVAGILAFNMAVAILLAHSGDLFSLGKHGGWAVELPMFYLLASLVIVLIGGGRIRINVQGV